MARKTRKVPQRTCVGCRMVKAKNELIRIVRRPTGEVEVDFTGRVAGRGAYICPNNECLQAAVQGRRLERALAVSVSPETLQVLQERLEAGE